MRIFFQELRKLFRPVPLLAALAVALLCARGPIHHYLYTLPRESEAGAVIAVYAGWRDQYGTTLDPDELPGIQADLEALYAEADETIAHWDESKWAQSGSFSGAGITNYEQYLALLNRTNRDLSENTAAALLLDSRTHFLQMRISAVSSFLEQVETNGGQAAARPDGARERARREAVAANPELTHSLLYARHLSSAQEFAGQVELLVMMAISIIVSPYPVREKLCRMAQMQWPTRTGRTIESYQLAAVLTFSALFSAVVTAVYGVCYCISWRAAEFWDCMAYSPQIPWFDLTYGQYLLSLGAMMVGLGTACGAVIYFLSQSSGHYISMLFKAVPAFLASAFLADRLLIPALFFREDFPAIRGTEPLLTALLLALSLVLACFTAHRRQTRELLF